jgi:hypothetical protein
MLYCVQLYPGGGVVKQVLEEAGAYVGCRTAYDIISRTAETCMMKPPAFENGI